MIQITLSLTFIAYLFYKVKKTLYSGNYNFTKPKNRSIINTENSQTAVIYSKNTNTDTLIFTIHGFSSNANYYDPLVNHFKNQYSILSYDLYGHGWSPSSNKNCKIQLFTNQAINILNQYRDNYKKISIISSSMGTMIHEHLISCYPEISCKNIFITPSGLGIDVPIRVKLCYYFPLGEIIISLFGRELLINLYKKCYNNKDNIELNNIIFIDIHKGFLKTLLSINRNIPKSNYSYKNIPSDSLVIWSSRDNVT